MSTKKGRLGTRAAKEFGFDASDDFIAFGFSDEDAPTRPSRPTTATARTIPADPAPPIDDSTRSSNPTRSYKRKRQDDEETELIDLKRHKPKSNPSRQPQPWMHGDIRRYVGDIETATILHREIQDFIDFLSPTPEEQAVRDFAVRRVSESISKYWPGTNTSAFGSVATKLYLPDGYRSDSAIGSVININPEYSDIDLVVSRNVDRQQMWKMRRWLEQRGIGRDFTVIASAKVPIVKFRERITDLQVDISFGRTNGLAAIQFILESMERFPALKPLVLLVKLLMKNQKISDPANGGLGSFSIICLVTSFLQMHPKTASGQILAERNLGVLLMEFFELYGFRFNFDRVGLGIDNGGYYFDRNALGFGVAGQAKLWKGICIRDPLDASNNISKASYNVNGILDTFRDAFEDLTLRCYEIDAEIKRGEEAPWKTRHGSLLDSILTISPRLLGTRRHLQRVYRDYVASRDSATLSKAKSAKVNRRSFSPPIMRESIRGSSSVPTLPDNARGNSTHPRSQIQDPQAERRDLHSVSTSMPQFAGGTKPESNKPTPSAPNTTNDPTIAEGASLQENSSRKPEPVGSQAQPIFVEDSSSSQSVSPSEVFISDGQPLRPGYQFPITKDLGPPPSLDSTSNLAGGSTSISHLESTPVKANVLKPNRTSVLSQAHISNMKATGSIFGNGSARESIVIHSTSSEEGQISAEEDEISNRLLSSESAKILQNRVVSDDTDADDERW